MVTDELQINITANTGNAAQNINQTAKSLDDLGESAKTADSGMSEFVRAMSEAAANMVQVSSNLAVTAGGLSSFKDSFDGLNSTLQTFSSQFSAVNAAVSNASFGDTATNITALSDASKQTADAFGGIVTASDGFADRMDALADTTHGTTYGMVQLQKELQETLTSIRGFSDNMGNAGRDAEDTSRKIRELSDDVQKLVQNSKSGSTAVMGLAAGFKSLKGIVATLGIGKFIKDSNDAYNVQMQNELKLTAHMKQRMNATDDEVQSIKDLASAQQQLGVIGDEIQLAGAQQLTTYARQSSTLKTLLPAMNNLIAQNAGYEASAGDATSAADMLGRALNGQYTSLKRMGVAFTEAQEQVLKYGTESQKASVLAEAINSKVGNMNELLAQTPTGKLKQLRNDFGDLQEELGATFQPLISAVIPVVRNVLDTLAPPIMNVSKGITVIGQAIASIDSPAVRGIALAAAGVAIVNKLKFALGGTSAGLLLLGVILTGIIGSMQEQQESIGDIVSDAYNSAANAAGDATGAISEYNDEIANTQKSINRLAGFDTITKLSGGSSSGALVNALLGDNGLSDIYAATDAANDLGATISDIPTPSVNVNTSEALAKIQQFGKDAADVFIHWGDDEAVYAPLSRMTQTIEDLLNAVGLDGTAFVNFWKGVGEDVQKDWRTGLVDIDTAFRTTFGKLGEAWSDYWQGFGTDLTEYAQFWQAANNGDFSAASAYAMKMQTSNPYLSEKTKNAMEQMGNSMLSGDKVNANIQYGEAMAGVQEQIEDFQNFLDTAQRKNPLNPEIWGLNYQEGFDNFFGDIGNWIGSTARDIQGYNAGFYTGQRDIFNQPIGSTQTDYRDIPTKTTSSNWQNGGVPPLTVLLDSEPIAAKVVSNTDSRANTENYKYD